MSNVSLPIKPTSVKINEQGGLEIFQNGYLVTTITGRSWRAAIANGTSIFALGAAGTIVEINDKLEINAFSTRIRNSVNLQWINDSLYVFKDDGTADIFVDKEYVKTHIPEIPPTPTPTVTPTPTSTPTPTPTNTPTPSSSADVSAQPFAETSSSVIKNLKQQHQTSVTPTPTPSPSTTKQTGLLSRFTRLFS